MSWLRAGVVAVTNGSKDVHGIGTSWSMLRSGDVFFLSSNRGAIYEVDRAIDDTHLVLTETYQGATASDQQYAIIQQFNNTPNATLAAQIAKLLAEMAARDAQLTAWATGSTTGGPNGNGFYPFTTITGDTILVPCPALIDPASAIPAPDASLSNLVTIGDVTDTVTLDLSKGSVFSANLTAADCAVSIVNPNVSASKAQHVRIVFRQGTGSNKVSTWPGNVRWNCNRFPVWAVTKDYRDSVDLFSIDGGGTWMAFFTGSRIPL